MASYQDPIDYQGNGTGGSINCQNLALIESNKAKYGTLCQHSDSIGFRTAHSCVNRNGKSYLCVLCGEAHFLVGGLAFLRKVASWKRKIANRRNRQLSKRRL